MDIAVSYHDTVTKLQEFADLARGPFDRAEWYELLDDPLIVVGKSRQGAVALPLRKSGTGLESLTYFFTFAWRPLTRNDEWAIEVLGEVARKLRVRTPRIDFSPVPAEDGSKTMLESAFRKTGWLVLSEQCDENHILAVDGRSFAEYWSYRPSKMRTTLKRKAKKVDVEILSHFDVEAWKAYQSVYAESWKPVEERADILERFARVEGEASRLRLGIARSDGRPVAVQFWTVEKGTAYIHKLAHTEAAKPLSAGTTLSAALFEHVIDVDGVELIDFGTGSDAYKRDWMESVRLRYRITCLDWRQPRAWSAIAKAILRKVAPHKRRG